MMFAATMDEKTKKIILVLCALFILLLLTFGFIYLVIDKYVKRKAKVMDNYMYPLLKTGIVKNKKDFVNALYYHENRLFFNESKWGFRLAILLTSVAFAVVYMCFQGNYNEFFTKVFELIPIVKWQTIGSINESLSISSPELQINGPSWLPVSIFPSVISKNPDFTNPMLYCSMLYYVSMIFALIILTKAVLAYIGRISRGLLMSKKVFERDLEKIDLDAINT